jgi:3-hydroxyacyl-CoA dehydrogenase / enoyl-CoA hydratase / 3-hydroxybutyryl-CoA epimerase
MKDRILFIQAIETVRILEEKVLTTVGDANIGSIFGFGFAPWSGGTLQFINSYGVRKFAERAKELADAYGARFTPPKLLLEKSERNENF